MSDAVSDAVAAHPPSPRTRGLIALDPPACTVCMLCVRECPVWCIRLDSHSETERASTPHGRPRTVHVLDAFSIDRGLCMDCGICVEVCPFDALFWAPVPVPAERDRTGLVHDQPRLAGWLAEVPPSRPGP